MHSWFPATAIQFKTGELEIPVSFFYFFLFFVEGSDVPCSHNSFSLHFHISCFNEYECLFSTVRINKNLVLII